jgi:hypothetical protein
LVEELVKLPCKLRTVLFSEVFKYVMANNLDHDSEDQISADRYDVVWHRVLIQQSNDKKKRGDCQHFNQRLNDRNDCANDV